VRFQRISGIGTYFNQFYCFRADYRAIGDLVGVTQGAWALTLGLGEICVGDNIALFFTKYLQMLLLKKTLYYMQGIIEKLGDL
jgi:hypothetical protein